MATVKAPAPTIDPDHFEIGDRYVVNRFEDGAEREIVIEITGAREPHRDMFGREQFKHMCKRMDTGATGYMIYGFGAQPVRRAPAADLDLERCIDTARGFLPIMREITRREFWCGYTIVRTSSGRLAVFQSDAWTKPIEAPLLPWRAPEGTPVATVDMDGVVHHLPEEGA